MGNRPLNPPVHVGIGPTNTFTSDYYSAKPNQRAECLYDDEITFTKDATNNVVLTINNKGQSFMTAAAASYGKSGADNCYAILLHVYFQKVSLFFRYGRIEMKAKLPSGGGTWPAFWALGSNIDAVPWPGCGEIDNMEHVGNSQNRILSTLHYPGHSGGNGITGSTTIQNASTEFHLYIMNWTANKLEFAVDGKMFHTVANTADTPFKQDFFLILNLTLGGNLGGAIDPNFTSSTFEVDYIRIYK